MKGDLDTVPRIVRPRQPSPERALPIIAVDQMTGLARLERSGRIVPVAELPSLTLTEPPSIWVCPNFSWVLRDLDLALSAHSLWQYRVSPIKREIVSRRNVDSKRRGRTVETCVNYFGYRSSVPKKRGYWHHALDPILFSQVSLGDLFQPDALIGLTKWAIDVRTWCQLNGLRISPTAGGLAAQLLRDPRFYPDARRKVPRQTNARARQVLPGNYYRVYGKPGKAYDAIYLDMAAAHHHAAVDLAFPHADGLIARGYFRDTDPTVTTVPEHDAWMRPTGPAFSHYLERSYGLHLLRLSVPKLQPGVYPLPCLERPGQTLAWIWSNELPLLRQLSISIDGIEASWASYKRDTGLNAYARWALTQIDGMPPERKVWAKPTLLAAYGVLASKPKRMETGHRRGTGRKHHYPAGHGTIPAYVHERGEQEPPVTNVIQRGMIEAETRLRVLAMARDLTARGAQVLAIYADAVMVEASAQLPLLPSPWTTKTPLTRLRFHGPQAFTSAEMVRLPGVSGEDRRRLEMIARFRNLPRDAVESTL